MNKKEKRGGTLSQMPPDPLNVFLMADCTNILFFNSFSMNLFALFLGTGAAL